MKRSFLTALFFIVFSTTAAMSEESLQHGKETVYSLDTIIVTSEKMTEYVKNHPQRVVVIDRREIKERNFLELGEALDSMPGVDVKQSGSGSGYSISIRGSGLSAG
jgi:outer membrane receptor for ferrienterochelin and colicin